MLLLLVRTPTRLNMSLGVDKSARGVETSSNTCPHGSDGAVGEAIVLPEVISDVEAGQEHRSLRERERPPG